MDTEDKVGLTIVIILAILLVGFMGMIIGDSLVDIKLNQETADDVCRQLTNDLTAVASDSAMREFGDGKLICSIPSFDATQNIIVKTNNE